MIPRRTAHDGGRLGHPAASHFGMKSSPSGVDKGSNIHIIELTLRGKHTPGGVVCQSRREAFQCSLARRQHNRLAPLHAPTQPNLESLTATRVFLCEATT